MKPVDQPEGLRAYYRKHDVVAQYLRRRTAQPLNGYLHAAQVRFLNDVIRQRAPRQILEIAPGPARLTAELDFNGRGVAIDTSPAMLAAARERLRERGREWTLMRSDAFALPFSDACFDTVYTFKFIRHFAAADRHRLYAEIRRVLAPRGAFLLDAQNRAVSLPHRRRKGLERYPIYDVLYDLDELSAEIKEAGFEVRRIEGVLYHFPLQARLNRLRRVGLGQAARLLIALLDQVPGRTPSTWMVLSESLP
jgi:ubiquinone/menaquinone biosynthesis C-methylase UbiE